MNEIAASILKANHADPSEFEVDPDIPGVWTGEVPGTRATNLWFALRDAFEAISLWPVIRGEPAEQDYLPFNTADILSKVCARPLQETLSPWVEKQRSFAEIMGLKLPPDADAATLAKTLDASGAFEFIGRKRSVEPWPTEPPAASKIEFASTREVLSRKTFPAVVMSLIALRNPYEAPAYLGFGGWNECPEPEIQVEVLRNWYERFGAVPAAITAAVMECVVARPPQTEPESFNLAVEQWLFCNDIVSQGAMSIRRLAISLWRSPQWYFWWD